MKARLVYILLPLFCLLFTGLNGQVLSPNDKGRKNVEYLYKDAITTRLGGDAPVLKLYPVNTDTGSFFNRYNAHWKLFDINSRVAKGLLDYDPRDSSNYSILIDRRLLLQGLGLPDDLMTDTALIRSIVGDSVTPHPPEVDGDINNELQSVDTFLISANNLYLSLDRDSVPALSVDLSPFATDTALIRSIVGDSVTPHPPEVDGSVTNELQDFDAAFIDNDTLKLSLDQDPDTARVLLSAYLDNTDSQTIDTAQTFGDSIYLSLSGDGQAAKIINISAYRQTIDTAQLIDDTLRLSLSGDNQPVIIIDLKAYERKDKGTTIDTVVASSNTTLNANNERDHIFFIDLGSTASANINTLTGFVKGGQYLLHFFNSADPETVTLGTGIWYAKDDTTTDQGSVSVGNDVIPFYYSGSAFVTGRPASDF